MKNSIKIGRPKEEKKQLCWFCGLCSKESGSKIEPINMLHQEESSMKKVTVNAVGAQCPIPVVEATRALRSMTEPGPLEV